MLNIFIVDDHKVLADGIKALLSNEVDVQVTHYAADGQEALAVLAVQKSIDLILLDINLPDTDGVALCADIHQQYPDIPVIALTMHHEPAIISRMIRAGAKGYLLKNTGKTELVQAIQQVHKGGSYYSKEVTDRLLQGMQPGESDRSSHHGVIPKITRREKEVLKLIVAEHTTEEMAEKLFISPSTVISHRRALLRKLNAKNVAGLVKAAYELDLLD